MNSVTMCDGCVAVLGGGKIIVTIDTDRLSESFCRVQVAFFKKPLLPLRERKTDLPQIVRTAQKEHPMAQY